MLLQIQHCYRIEEQLLPSKAGLQKRHAVRACQSRMIIERSHRVLSQIKLKRQHLPKSTMGTDIDYALTLWSMRLVYLDIVRIEPERSGDSQPQVARRASRARQNDKYLVEKDIRPTAIGKKIFQHVCNFCAQPH